MEVKWRLLSVSTAVQHQTQAPVLCTVHTHCCLDLFDPVLRDLRPGCEEKHLFLYLVLFVQGVQMQDVSKLVPVIDAECRTWQLPVHGADGFLQTLRTSRRL